MKKNLKIELTELFMAQASMDRCFYGIIKKTVSENNLVSHFSKIKVNDGYIVSCAADRDTLGKQLDEMCVMVLDKKLHEHGGVYTKYLGMKMYLN